MAVRRYKMGKYEDYNNLLQLEYLRFEGNTYFTAFEQCRYQLEKKYNLNFPTDCYYLSTFAQYFNKQVIGN